MEQEFLLLLKLFLTGIFLGLLYDCLRIWRSVMTNSRFWIDLQDLIYWSSAGLFVFYVIYMENNGQIRVYALAGMAAGALFYYATISRWIVRLFGFLLLKIVTLFGILLTPLHRGRKRLKLWIKRVKLFCMNKSRYKKSGRIRMRKKENQKFSRKRREKLKKDENRQPESKTAMISVILVASALSISLMARSYALEEKIGDYKSQRKEVKAQISAEEQRTKEIEALKEYMQSDEYAKQVAREKLGLVEGDEIIFKEK